MQSLEIGALDCQYWEFIHPFAWLYHLSAISGSFANMMRSALVDGEPLRIVIYADGLVPGNPFRPEVSRNLMCIYWCIADWPDHVLHRSFAWPVFSILRLKVISTIQGGLGRLMRMVLRVFFATVGHSFTTGVHIPCPGGDFVATGISAGLVGHKEMTSWKGHAGLKCCMTCENVLNCLFRAVRDGEVSCSCSKISEFKYRSNEDIFNIVDSLAIEFGRLTNGSNEKI